MALGLYEQGRDVIRRFANVLQDRIESVNVDDVVSAMTLADRIRGLSARDLIHLSIMTRLGVDAIVSADHGFSNISGVNWFDPGDLNTWQRNVSSSRS